MLLIQKLEEKKAALNEANMQNVFLHQFGCCLKPAAEVYSGSSKSSQYYDLNQMTLIDDFRMTLDPSLES